MFDFVIITISIYVIVLPHCNSMHDYILMTIVMWKYRKIQTYIKTVFYTRKDIGMILKDITGFSRTKFPFLYPIQREVSNGDITYYFL